MSGIAGFSMAFHPRLKYPAHCDEEIPFPPPSSLVLRNDTCFLCATRGPDAAAVARLTSAGSAGAAATPRLTPQACRAPEDCGRAIPLVTEQRWRGKVRGQKRTFSDGARKGPSMTEPSNSERQGTRHPASSFRFYGGMSNGLD